MTFSLDSSNPADNAVVSAFPNNERSLRTTLQGWIAVEHDEGTGRHKIPIGSTTARDALTDWQQGSLFWNTTVGALQLQTASTAPFVWTNVISTTAYLLLAGGTLTGALNLDGVNLNGKETGGTLRRLVAYDKTNNQVDVGDTGRQTKIVGTSDLLFNANKVWHQGNDGTGSGLDADLVRGVAADFTATFATNGYQKLPGGGLLQYGYDATIGTRTITFPIAFPNACRSVNVTYVANTGGDTNNSVTAAPTTTSFGVAGPYPCYWMAFGN